MPSRVPSANVAIQTQAARRERRRRRRLFWLVGTLSALAFCVLGFVGMAVLSFLTPWGRQLRLLLAETVISTRHSRWAHWLVTPHEYAQLWKQINAPVFNTGLSGMVRPGGWSGRGPVIEVHFVRGSTYNGYVMLVHDPRLIRLVEAHVHGSEGEYITDMARRVGAVAGTNASGFEDPNGNGWGGIPVGLEYVDGVLVHPAKNDPAWTTVGFTSSGLLVMGHYTVPALQAMGVRDAMQFRPELVVNGKPMITVGDGGWGLGPRTAIGQARDGTVIFIVLNGRFHGGAGMGASQRQVMDLMLQYGAVNACAMDGGSSSVLYYHGKIINAPSTIDPHGERHLPDAWLVFPTEAAANAYHAGM
ncbi:exopolysaccharide biosynthesis protein [Alicyclobacillus cellulosilyticus]|uniref:Exopolysaccharide biosynthesis protein n=1 Tax=Alicyclobacillus cellulosilyticus TaxID=1003997 RepID=A0A917K895_9BACL|nr:phosphodiester glycosidase family protein [Alicyclobacillus cellulosilyticus]GGJ01795.1 exopolysaccharide biosynthesis protein [Alicyclobacillus cellulosilyticus]